VALFTDRVEVKKADLSDAELEAKIKDKINRFMQVTDVIDVVESQDVVDEVPQNNEPTPDEPAESN
jgi:uncharacterized Fe-S cluster-containing protein